MEVINVGLLPWCSFCPEKIEVISSAAALGEQSTFPYLFLKFGVVSLILE